MVLKYERLDTKLLNWLGEHLNQDDQEITTALAAEMLGVSGPTIQRHISRRFSQLEGRGVLVCTLKGTTRVCRVMAQPPTTLAKKKWQARSVPQTSQPLTGSSISAENSQEFEAAGGNIERLSNGWNKKQETKSTGIITFSDFLSSLD